MTANDQEPAPNPETDTRQLDHDRRAALRKLGALAIWTPPAMLILLRAQRASADNFGSVPIYP